MNMWSLSFVMLLLLSLLSPVLSSSARQKSHYDTLGVAFSADTDQIRNAYRKKALETHPDKVPAKKKAEAIRRFQRINEAHSVLSDPDSRRQYDASLRQKSFIHQSEQQRGRPRARELPFIIGCTLRELGGWQQVPLRATLAAAGLPTMVALQLGIPAFVSLPPGSREGDVVGIDLDGGWRLLLTLREMPSRSFTRHGDDLYASVSLPAWHNLRRTPVRLRPPCGTRITVVPRGTAVEHGGIERVKSYGMPAHGARGDLLVHFRLLTLRASLMRLGARVVGLSALLGLGYAALSPVGDSEQNDPDRRGRRATLRTIARGILQGLLSAVAAGAYLI